MSFADFALSRGMSYYADPNATGPAPTLPPVPPPEGPPSIYMPTVDASYDAARPLPYDPNASPTESWAVEPMPSNVTTPMDPYKGLPLDQIPPQRAWSSGSPRGY